MTVTYQVINLSDGGGSENLLINPRGKINQLNDSDGVLAPHQYFCDGWKAGASGAEVYRDSDGFRLISGSILQLVPNELDAGRSIRGNLDIISGTPTIRINGGSDSELSDAQASITFEVFGNNSKFTRLILAESDNLPIYQQVKDELTPCKKFLQVCTSKIITTYTSLDAAAFRYGLLGVDLDCAMHRPPAVTVTELNMYHGGSGVIATDYASCTWSKVSSIQIKYDDSNQDLVTSWNNVSYIADARL
ncbi:hypothetical protein VCRA213O314_630026 [Vibrio crassostreae]|nr:hypothetical protein VCRA213O314_630026 [Vibrio crassostreae]